MRVTHYAYSDAVLVAADTTTDLITDCFSYEVDNIGDVDVKVFFNGDTTTYALVKSHTSKAFGLSSRDTICKDTIGLEFVSAGTTQANFVRQYVKLAI